MAATHPLDATAAPSEAVSHATAGRGRGGRWWRDIGWRHLVAVAALAFALFPVVWIVSSSISSTGTLQGGQLIPDQPTLRNYDQLLATQPYLRWLANSLIVAGTAAIGIVLLCALAAFSFSRMRFRGRRLGLLSLLLVQMFPQLLAFVAIYLLMVRIGAISPSIGIGTRAGLILVYLGGALGVNTWLMKGFFDTIPAELDEAAAVDGASHAQIFFRIIMPLAAPILAVVGMLAFIFIINDFLLASALLSNPDDWTLSVGLFRFIDERYGARWGQFTAGALMGGVPVIVLFLFLQRYIASGLTQGSVKG